MSKPRVLVAHSDIPKKAIQLLQGRCDTIFCPGVRNPSREQLLSKIEGVDALFWFSKVKIDKELLDKAGPNLKVVATMSAGYDHIDVKEVKSRGIKIGITPKVLDAAVADVAMALALAVARRMPEGRQKIESKQWETSEPQWMLGQDFQESTVGIVGLGGIGQAIARRVKGFDIARLLYTGHSPKPEGEALNAEFVSLDELLKQSDFVFLACSLNSETVNLINKEALGKMKSNAILVNVSRGGVIDQEALIEALESRKIWGAGLDVMTPEPLPSDHRLLSIPNCVLLPHLGSATLKTRTNMALLTVKNIFAALDGEPLPSSI
ncbi:glyoxylate reductase/hydroxypyruvate reductase-like [Schistocerca nitens]|uniref:glyoxylate reductase/hydroxypyruvate reductase-like n=1 Tax=Schistocerca nitens TaxID=7011 RepID=UPI0021188A77|nr:glyoxylate reductase/hydroxypyruvate reductase-like isoform X1 [Schistocerca cancellata]XP_049802068.1 glyoxylate reductase/hydroxypyruvate reductase-like [Schistocerca nitens]XP_049802069.1 glyoxylate reductase/hydroxypyruvate reductase-like [Schistocerca nitens]